VRADDSGGRPYATSRAACRAIGYRALMRRRALLASFAISFSAFIVACSSNDASSSATTDDAGGTDSSSATDSGSGADSGGNTDSGSTGDSGDASTSDAAEVDGATSCTSTTTSAQLPPVDLMIMFDQSGSMSDTTAAGGTKWDAVTGALNAFVAQPGLAGTSIGIQYFGLPTTAACPASCTTDADCNVCGGLCLGTMCFGGGAYDSCVAADYAKPDVEIAPLPGASTAISTSLAAHMPSTSTPTAPAMQGALDHAKAWAAAHPGHVVAVVFVTDGEPTECSPMDQAGVAAIAAAALAGTPSVKTFAIGIFAVADIPSGPNLLNAVAIAGGTGQAHDITTTMDVSMAFGQAMNSVRSSLGCGLPIPSGTSDYAKVNVLTTPAGGAQQVVGYVGNSGQCDAMKGGWYYDVDPSAGTPTQIVLCTATCGSAHGTTSAQVSVQVGCETTKGT
jgi:hypothetical protein